MKNWKDADEIWVEGDVWWYSSKWLAKALPGNLRKIAGLREHGILTRFKEVPRASHYDFYGPPDVNARREQGEVGTILVHHEDEVFEQLGIGRKADQAAANGNGIVSAPAPGGNQQRAGTGIDTGAVINEQDGDEDLSSAQKKNRWCYERCIKKDAKGEFAYKLTTIHDSSRLPGRIRRQSTEQHR